MFYDLIKDFYNHNVADQRFENELAQKIKQILIDYHGEEKYLSDAKTNKEVYMLLNIIMELYRSGIEVGKGATMEYFEQKAVSDEARTQQWLNSGILKGE